MATDIAPGTVIAGDFRVEKLIGRGGMGAVYRALQLSTDRPRALKLLHPLLVDDEAMRARFFREARIGSRIASDHVVEVIASGLDGATPWLAMELLEGEDLATRLVRGPLEVSEAHALFAQLGDALAAAHAVGIVHRDLKPENVFLVRARREGVAAIVKVLDFGIAKLLADAASQTAPCGTPLYMAPEQASGEGVTPAADVWALGLLVFRALTGRHYWKSATSDKASPISALREAAVDELVPASQRAAELGVAARLPAGFDAWFARTVVRDVAARFPEGGQATSALLPLLGGDAALATGETLAAPITPAPHAMSPPLPFASVAPARRSLAPAIAGGLLAICVVGYLAMRALRPPTPAAPTPAAKVEVAAVAAPPPVERWLVPVGDAPTLGPADAPVTIVEFADFQCPFSKTADAMVNKLLARFPNKIRFAWKDYPMGAHADADAASQLAREARAQKGSAGFWRAHDLLFARSPSLDVKSLDKVAAELGLDASRAHAAITTEPFRAALDGDVDGAVHLGDGAIGIPTFFVNGRKVEGANEVLYKVVEEELGEARRREASGVAPAHLYDDFQRGARDGGKPRPRVSLPDPKDRPSRGGRPDKALAVHEFCDLANLACAWVEPVLRRTLDSYGDEVRLVWWDIPDPQQPTATRFYRAAHGADNVPGGFWKMHDFILAKERLEGFAAPPPEELSAAVLRVEAKRLGVDMSIYDYVMATGYGNNPAEPLDEARKLTMDATDLVIDGDVYNAFMPPRILRAAIDRALAKRR